MVRIINRSSKFKSKLKKNEKEAIEGMGEFGVMKMNDYVPFDTGYLMSRNTYQIAQNEVYLQNDCDYGKYQEFGTYKMKAQPFMKPAIYNHLADYKRIYAYYMGRGM